MQGPSSPQSQSQAAPQSPPQVVVVKQPRGAWNSCVGYGCLATAALFVFVAATAWCGSGHPTPGSRSPAASEPPATLRVLLDKSGSGINTTPKFSAASDWQIVWSYDCASFGSSGNFIVTVYDADGSLSDVAVNELGAKGSDTTNEHQGGTYYLQVNSECKWHVIVKG